MDEKYIENLGMSANVDEGLWDRLKSRASVFKQAAQNLSGTNVGDTESTKFNTIFKSFIKKSVQTIEDLIRVLQPYVQVGKLSAEQTTQLQKFADASVALQQVEKLPLSEANLFTRPFSSLGAIATGNPDKILDAYKAQIDGHYQSFLKDAQRLNIVPANYIPRKVASISPAVPEAMQKLGDALGKQLVGAPATASRPMPTGALPPSAPTTPPAAPTPPAPAPEAPAAPVSATVPSPVPPTVPKADTSTEPESSMLAPMAKAASAAAVEPEKPTVVAPAAEKPIEPAKPEELKSSAASEVAQIWASLGTQAIEKIITSVASGDMIDLISGYVKRDASKAETTFPAKPPVEVKLNTGTIILWHLRYQNSREIQNHQIQILAEKQSVDKKVKRSNEWEDFIIFGAEDVIDDNGDPIQTFDVMAIIKKTNPDLGNTIENGLKISGMSISPDTNKKMATALSDIAGATMPDSNRGDREIQRGSTAARGDTPDKTVSGLGTPPPPIEGPKKPEPQEKPAPERRSRTVQSAPSSPKSAAKPAAKKPEVKKPEAKKPDAPKAVEKPTSKPAPKKEEPPKAAEPAKSAAVGSKAPPIPKEKYADYLRAKAAKEKNLEEGISPGLKDFFSL